MSTSSQLSSDLDLAVRAAQAGAATISTILKDGGSLDIRHKGRHDLVTRADTASEEAIISVIQSAFPDDLILGEEGVSESQYVPRPSSHVSRTWIIDPIDGTTNFAHGVPFYGISIALWERNQPVAAVVHAPALGETFTASAGGGAFLNGRPIRVSGITDPEMALIGTGFPYRDLDLLDDYMRIFRRLMRETQGVRRPGSASLDLCYVAAGRYDGFYEYGLAPWDVAAGGLIVKEAGGLVTDWTSGDNWLHGKRIIAANSAIHEYLSKCIIEDVHPDRLEQPRHSSS
jgi:myo-inositol-1(or 4)-monophosphatase